MDTRVKPAYDAVRTMIGHIIHPNDPSLRSFIDVDPSSDFPIQNLPYGVFSTGDGLAPRVGVAIGDSVLDLAALEQAACSTSPLRPAGFPTQPQPLHGAGAESVVANPSADQQVAAPRSSGTARQRPAAQQGAGADARRDTVLPIGVGGYTDFYSSKEHATNVGIMLRGQDNALQPNWLHMPVAYNGRASTVVVGGTPVRRPLGQRKPPAAETPSFGPSRRLDFELEMGVFVGRPSARRMLTEAQARHDVRLHAAQRLERARHPAMGIRAAGAVPGQELCTSIGPWIVTLEALEPFRVHGPQQDPEPLPYLQQTGANNYDIKLEVGCARQEWTAPQRF